VSKECVDSEKGSETPLAEGALWILCLEDTEAEHDSQKEKRTIIFGIAVHVCCERSLLCGESILDVMRLENSEKCYSVAPTRSRSITYGGDITHQGSNGDEHLGLLGGESDASSRHNCGWGVDQICNTMSFQSECRVQLERGSNQVSGDDRTYFMILCSGVL